MLSYMNNNFEGIIRVNLADTMRKDVTGNDVKASFLQVIPYLPEEFILSVDWL